MAPINIKKRVLTTKDDSKKKLNIEELEIKNKSLHHSQTEASLC
jgi:hypothetical protein